MDLQIKVSSFAFLSFSLLDCLLPKPAIKLRTKAYIPNCVVNSVEYRPGYLIPAANYRDLSG